MRRQRETQTNIYTTNNVKHSSSHSLYSLNTHHPTIHLPVSVIHIRLFGWGMHRWWDASIPGSEICIVIFECISIDFICMNEAKKMCLCPNGGEWTISDDHDGHWTRLKNSFWWLDGFLSNFHQINHNSAPLIVCYVCVCVNGVYACIVHT